MKVESLSQAIDEAVRLLQQPKYRTHKQVIKITEKLMVQGYYFTLRDKYGRDERALEAGGVCSEKTGRSWRDGDQASFRGIGKLRKYIRRIQ
jgi:hypothetical protein